MTEQSSGSRVTIQKLYLEHQGTSRNLKLIPACFWSSCPVRLKLLKISIHLTVVVSDTPIKLEETHLFQRLALIKIQYLFSAVLQVTDVFPYVALWNLSRLCEQGPWTSSTYDRYVNACMSMLTLWPFKRSETWIQFILSLKVGSLWGCSALREVWNALCCSRGCPCTCDPSASASSALALQARTAMPSFEFRVNFVLEIKI